MHSPLLSYFKRESYTFLKKRYSKLKIRKVPFDTFSNRNSFFHPVLVVCVSSVLIKSIYQKSSINNCKNVPEQLIAALGHSFLLPHKLQHSDHLIILIITTIPATIPITRVCFFHVKLRYPINSRINAFNVKYHLVFAPKPTHFIPCRFARINALNT